MSEVEIVKRVELFKSECLLFSLPFSEIEKIYPIFWDSLYDIVTQKPHEQHSTYNGLIFAEDYVDEDYCLKNNSHVIRDYYLADSADGKSVFCLSSNTCVKNMTLIFKSELSQIDLLSIVERDGNNTVIITRENMEIRVFFHGTISVYENRDWIIYSNKTMAHSFLHTKQIYSPFIERLFDFAYYDLAVNKIGASLAIHTDDSTSWPDTVIKEDELNICISNSDNLDFSLLQKYARTHDGAILINHDGSLGGISAKLKPTGQTVDDTEKKYHFGGLRHTMSCAYTCEHRNTMVLTTSDDGGATVFFDGKIVLSNKNGYGNQHLLDDNSVQGVETFTNVKRGSSTIKRTLPDYSDGWKLGLLTLNNLPAKTNISNSHPHKKSINNEHPPKRVPNYSSSQFESIKKMVEEYGESSEIEFATAKCPKCHQQYWVGYIRVPGWNDHEELRCDNCGTLYYSKSCFKIVGAPIHEDSQNKRRIINN